MKKQLIFFNIFLFTQLAFSQINIFPLGNAQCPDQWITYTASGQGCNFYWEVTNGEIQGGTQSSSKWTYSGGNSISVKWNNNGNNGSMNVTTSNCNNSYNNGTINEIIAILTLQGVTPGGIWMGATNIPANNTNLWTYEAAPTYLSRGINDPLPYEVNGYEWEVPSGWTISSGGNTNRVRIKADAYTQGNIRVRAKLLGCDNSPYYSDWSQPLAVTRSIEAPSAINGNGGYDYVLCGQTTPITFTTPPVAGASSYTWTKPSGWSGTSTSNSITLIPNGSNGGIITVKANAGPYTSSTTSIALSLVQIDPNNLPVITGPSSLCNGSQASFSLSIPPGASINWTTWSGLSIVSGQGNSSITAQANSVDGGGWVQATISNTCGGPISTDKYYFSQAEPTFSYDLNISNGAYGETGYFCTSHYGNTYTIDPNNNLDTHQIKIKSLSGTVLWSSSTRTGRTGSVNYYPSPGYYLIEVRATNSCGTSSWIQTEVEFVDCSAGGGGGESGESEAFMIYPNPTRDEVTIQEITNKNFTTKRGEIVKTTSVPKMVLLEVVDSNNIIKHIESCSQMQLTFSVHDWEKGTYYLKITTRGKTQIKRLIVE